MRIIFMVFAMVLIANSQVLALDQNQIKSAVDQIAAKAKAGQNIQSDVEALTERMKSEALAVVTTNKPVMSVVGKDGKVMAHFDLPPSTHVIAHEDSEAAKIAERAIAQNPQAKAAHMGDESATLFKSKKTNTTETAQQPSAADTSSTTTSSSSGGIGGLISAGINTAVNIASGAVSGLLSII